MTPLSSLRAALSVAAATPTGAHPLTAREMLALLAIDASDAPPRLGDLRRAALVPNAPRMTRMLDRLVHAGLVDRAEDRGDRRTCRISLTDAGRALVARLEAAMRSETEREPIAA